MNATSEQQKKVVELLKRRVVLRPRDLDRHGIPREILRRLCERGDVQRVGHGLYRLTAGKETEHVTLAEVCKQIPAGVVCLVSALRFHNLSTQAPFEVWLAIDVKAYRSRTDLPVRFVRFSGAALAEGVEVHKVDGVPVRVYNPAKTVADCFKYRNKIGLDVALEALKECRQGERCSMDDLWRYAKICRVANVMRPYLEAISA
jgi:predicted transcriptional regulator of viral defense system